jgi:putative transferase (TIGR04331 family)
MNGQLDFAEEITEKICIFLSKKIPSKLTSKQKIVLLTPWCRSFTHSALHYYFTKHPLQINKFNATNAPGDTLAFLQWYKTDDYSNYLSGNFPSEFLSGKIQTKTELLLMPHFTWAKTLVFQAGIKKSFLTLLSFLSFFRIRKLSYKKKIHEFSVDTILRNQILSELSEHLKEYKFAAWLSQKTLEMLPKILLEGIYPTYLNYDKNQSFDAIFSSDCWTSIDSFKIMAFAQKNRRKVKLIGTPHAFNYSALHNFWLRAYEISFLDKYLSWGTLQDQNSKALPFYINKFAGYKRSQSPKRVDEKSSILLTGAMRPNHLVEYPFEPEFFKQYLLQEINIALVTAETTNRLVKIRTRSKDRGGSFETLFNQNSPANVVLDFQSGTFINEVTNYSLHVSDNTSTTILESLIINHPTIIVIASEYFSIDEIARNSFETLKEANIFHTTIESYKSHLEKINGHINDWWHSYHTQLAISNFLDQHARIGGGVTIWKKTLLN